MPLYGHSFQRMLIITAAISITLLGTGNLPAANPANKPHNVLFIMADDQRPTLGCYGDGAAQTPNLDRLAKDGALFRHAYCQYPMCGPSRASILTGLGLDTVQVYDLHTVVRKHIPEVVTLPEFFKKRGYFTRAVGKIFHPGIDDPESWTEPTFVGPEVVGTTSITSGTEDGLPADPNTRGKRGPSWFAPDLPDEKFHDGVVTGEAIKTLNAVKDKPFFLAVGYNRPHLPFVAPKRYFDIYEDAVPPLASNIFPPEGVPPIAMTQSGELRQYRDIPATGPLSMAKARELTRAYYACTSFVDAQVGRLLDELERLKLDDNTVVVFVGDHGFHLGDNGIWAKYDNFEAATRAPLLFRAPDIKTSATIDTVVEFLDIFATVADLSGLGAAETQGKSLAPLLRGGPAEAFADNAALTQVNRGRGMGYSLRSQRYRYNEWLDENGAVIARELYDHETDPLENRNIANAPGNERLIEQLHQKMHQLKQSRLRRPAP